MDIKELADRVLLKDLVDKVSILADKKDIHAMAQLFSENTWSETFAGGVSILQLNGRKEMEEKLEGFLKNFETAYHLNGQQQVTINGDMATGMVYCLVVLVSTENGKKIQTTIGATYQDEYVREHNRWLIAKRIGNFEWQEKRECPTP